MHLLRPALLARLLPAVAAFSLGRAAEPVFNPTGPEAAAFGQAEGFPIGDRATWKDQTPKYLVGGYSHFDTIFPTHRVARAETPSPFSRAAAEPVVRYAFHGHSYTLTDYLAHFPVTGMLVLKGDTILLEHYQYRRTDADRFTSQSMAKSIMSLLAGIAVSEGKIHSIADRASDYLPALQGTPYGETQLRTLLQMSSGMNFNYDAAGHPSSADSMRMLQGLFAPSDPVELLGQFTRRFPPATQFHYSDGDNLTMGLVVHRATGMDLATYLTKKIWQPAGMEADATWVTGTSGDEFTCYGFSAVLRDWARLGRLLANDGAWHGRQIIPRQWVLDATTLHPADRQVAAGTATPYFGYGYQIWILPGDRRMFVFRGTDSQYVFVDPRSKLVWVQTAIRSEFPHAEDGESEALAVWLALVKQLGN